MGVSVIIRSLQEPVGRRRAVLRALCASRVPMSIAAIAGKLGVHPNTVRFHVTCVGEHETLTAAAQYMREHDIGALPICGDDDRLHGMLTDRDIVIKGLAAGLDPNTATAGELARDSIYYVDANASIQEMLNVMEEHQVRRVPVISEHRLVGIVTEADIARHLPEHAIVQFVKAICSPMALAS